MVEKSHTSGLWPQLYEPFRNFGQRLADWIAPASEASVNGDSYCIAIEVPGVAEDDIEISVSDGVVTVKGEKKSSREEKGETWYFSEREFGAFSRSFRLPPDADEGGVSGRPEGRGAQYHRAEEGSGRGREGDARRDQARVGSWWRTRAAKASAAYCVWPNQMPTPITTAAMTTAMAILAADHGRSPCTRPVWPFTTKR